MGKGVMVDKLRAWRRKHGFTMEEAGAHVVVDGKPTKRATWCGWEVSGKIPERPWMNELIRLEICEPNDFYPPWRRSSRAESSGGDGDGRTQGSSGPRPESGKGEPPQMALAL